MISDGIAGAMKAPHLESVALQVIAAGAGFFLLAGLWTPIAGVLVAVIELGIALLGTPYLASTILLSTIGAALAFLGPGAQSIDAFLFGRKRLDI